MLLNNPLSFYHNFTQRVLTRSSMASRRIVDLTHPLSTLGTPQTTYPGDPEFHLTPHATVAKDGYSVHEFALGTHTGTHIDAPCHFVEGGRSIDQIPLDDLVGRVCIIDFTIGESIGTRLKSRQKIECEDLDLVWLSKQPTDALSSLGFRSLKEALESGRYKALVVHTGWSENALADEEFNPSKFFGHPYFSSSIASYTLSTGVKIFGTDLPNPDETPLDEVSPTTGKNITIGGTDGYTFHERFLGGGGLIVENLANLKMLAGGDDWTLSVIPLKLEGADGSPVRAFAYHE